MDKIKVIHDAIGKTLTVWLSTPEDEYICEETQDEVVLMKNKAGKVIGFEILNYVTQNKDKNLIVETVLKTSDVA